MKLFILPCLLLLCGCSSHFEKAELVGLYKLNVGPGEDLIELHSDGTYLHTFQQSGAPKETGNGKWELEDLEGGQTVTLDDFQPLPGEHTTGRGFYLLQIKRFFFSIRLMKNADLGEYFEKEAAATDSSK